MDIVTEKYCYLCKKWKPKIEFNKNKRNKDGLKYECRECSTKEYRKYVNAHRDEINLKQKIKYYNNPEIPKNRRKIYRQEHAEKCRLSSRNWRFNNPEKYKESDKKTKEKYHERCLEYARKYSKEHREERRLWQANRKFRMRSGSGNITKSEWMELLEFYGYKCLRCKKTGVFLTKDHVIPLSVGGLHTIKNIQPLCGPCNSKKGIQTTDYR